MSINIDQLRNELRTYSYEPEDVSDFILSFTRMKDDCPFAKYYFDISQLLPDSPETLDLYQTNFISKKYFQGKKSLQWNNYLYFITSNENIHKQSFIKTKELIEGDRRYARKYVITEEELKTVLDPPKVAPSDSVSKANVTSTWMNYLGVYNLESLIITDEYLPERLRQIEESDIEPFSNSVYFQSNKIKSPQMIRSFYLEEYRDFPIKRDFNFGKVNLICGPNATGKTALLEALELFYCGRNKRNPDTYSDYRLKVEFEDGSVEEANNYRELQQYRDRNLSWYGQSEVKTNYLYQSFARFNFLDTDAAVSLSVEEGLGKRIEEDLSRLLVGPEAAKMWKNIGRVTEAIRNRLNEYLPLQNQIQEEVKNLTFQITESNNVKHESDSIYSRLRNIMQLMGWVNIDSEKESITDILIGGVSQINSLIQQITELDEEHPVGSLEGLVNYCNKYLSIVEIGESKFISLDNLIESQNRNLELINDNREALRLVNDVKQIIDSGILMRNEELNNHKNVFALCSYLLAGLSDDISNKLNILDPNESVNNCYQKAISNRKAKEELLEKAQNAYKDFRGVWDQSIALSQELRDIANKILQNSPDQDICPLCHHRYEKGELNKHINSDVKEAFKTACEEYLSAERKLEIEVGESHEMEDALSWLVNYCNKSNNLPEIRVHEALGKLEKTKNEFDISSNRVEALDSELNFLNENGLSMSRLEEISERLKKLEYPLSDRSQESLKNLLSFINTRFVSLSEEYETRRKNIEMSLKELNTILETNGLEYQDLNNAFSNKKERLSEAVYLKEKIEEISKDFPIKDKNFTKVSIDIKMIRDLANDLQLALGKERQALLLQSECSERKDYLNKQIIELTPKIERLKKVQSILENLIKEHPLQGAMESALQRNRNGIELIFKQIHSPSEFCGLGSDLTSLVRKTENSVAKISEISTGQRTALALSIFLAQNAQAKDAPPVLLIDDPIAHVDDLNSLSFLDYLREVVLSAKKQLFFATADEKLASLFEHKFDFLDTEFRRFDLSR